MLTPPSLFFFTTSTHHRHLQATQDSDVNAERAARLEALLSEAQEKERALVKDMKKKGDLARALLAEKEEESKTLAAQLSLLREAERERAERAREEARKRPPSPPPASSPLPGPVAGAALAAMTPQKLSSSSMENIDIATPSPFPSPVLQQPSGGGLSTMISAPRALTAAESAAQRHIAIKQMQNQLALLMSENQALKSRLQLPIGPDNLSSLEREQYLRQAFCALFRAKQGIEMQNLARVMCSILCLNDQEQAQVLEKCEVLGAVNLASNTIADLGGQISSLFN